MSRILCVGAFAMDTIFRLETLPVTAGKFLPLEAVEVAQGMAAAQAVAIAKLGGRVTLWASCGDDPIGDRMVAQIAEAGVDTSVIRRVRGARSGFASIFMDRRGERIIVPQYDPAVRSAPDAVPDLTGVTVVSTDVRWPDAAEMALQAARERGLIGLLDLDTGPRDVLERLLPHASHVVASEGGAAVVTGEADPARATAALAQRHSGFVAVTAGEHGCNWFDRAANAVRHLPAPLVEAVDTLAAGDVFHGGFAFGLSEGWPIERIIPFASAAAALKCTKFGGRLGAPTRAEVEAFL
ncbi:MAG TPA: PfkB family carbohydrate kinase [Devosia sp.]|nr:PfkB family carbohydrate kinase [Devosia sp.]